MQNKLDLDYLNLASEIFEEGTPKNPARENMPKTISLFGTRIEHDMSKGFPLLTTKKVGWKSVIHELLWFLREETNIKYLVDNNVNIWNQDAYRWYKKKLGTYAILTLDEFVEAIKKDHSSVYSTMDYKFGDLGKVYGHQWRNQDGVDQIVLVLNLLKENPLGRYAIIDAWNPSDFTEMALPPCHLLYQFNCRELGFTEKWNLIETIYDKKMGYDGALAENIKDADALDNVLKEFNFPKYYLDLQMYQRSCDYFLGVPYNLASMGFLLTILAKALNYVPGKMIWVGGDTHLYENHLTQMEEQFHMTSYPLPTLEINKELNSVEDIESLSIKDFTLTNYQHSPAIKAELKTGLI